MATKKCANGHLYDPSIYGDKCPFCPSAEGSTKVNAGGSETKVLGGELTGYRYPSPDVPKTQVLGGEGTGSPTQTITVPESHPGGTVIRRKDPVSGETSVSGNRRLVGLLVSYSANPDGEVYKVYEGRTTIGRDRACDISFPNDSSMTGKHLLIQYVAAKGKFMAKDMGSSNGINVNGSVYVMDEAVELKTNDKIVLGSTLFVFLTIPE